MLRILSASFVLFLGTAPVVHGQPQLPDNQLLEKLNESGIGVGFDFPVHRDMEKLTAIVRSRDLDPTKAVELLRQIKNLQKLKLDLKDEPLTEGHLKIIKELPAVKELEVRGYSLSAEALNSVAQFQHVESLTLRSGTFTPAHLKSLHQLKGAKKLVLVGAEVAPDDLAALKKVLFQVKEIDVERMPAILALPALKAGPNDNEINKLKIEKFNAALESVRRFYELIEAGGGGGREEVPTFGSRLFLEIAGNLRDAALGLGNPDVKLKVVNAYVDLLEIGDMENKVKMEVGTLHPYSYHRFRYHYLDAQLLKLQLQKERDQK